ncbi:MAG TPA: metalloregulator ArsR/SmtB family transcription factor [Rhizomicrobium sp.]|jgi:predicted ArsR family transcriptional regulator|nr:metalloregulator ArsR/SmtB family transcription factor [Rhizomicrobium sp.]
MVRTVVKSVGGRAAVLELVKRQAPVTAEELAVKLGVTGMAVRQHLEVLEKDGFVAHETRAAGRGRPSKRWRATAKADSCFADAHAALTVDLIANVREIFGEEGLQRVVTLRTAEQERSYRPQITGGKSLRARLEQLARIRSREGYMAQVRRDGPDTWLLLEHHCPICSAARACSGICREELQLFQRILGEDVRVERVSHILTGAARCAYRISAA